MKYTEILRKNKELSKSFNRINYEIAIISNITISYINDILEYTLRKNMIPAYVRSGDYDNIVQDSYKYSNSDVVIVFWELCNIVDGLQYKIELYDNKQFDLILDKIKLEIDLVFNNLQKAFLVLVNRFTSIQFSNSNIKKSNLDMLADQLNEYLENKTSVNVRLVDLKKVIAGVGVEKSLDLRLYYSSKALYRVEFFKAYADHVKPYIMSANGKAKKAIIFDCDNTLWKGILGEDGFDGIEMNPATKVGAVYAEIQNLALSLYKQGVLLGLCSKNNPTDVEHVLSEHPHMQIRDKHLTIKKVNWNDKATNLREISRELNIGLDSLVFVDDSDFEVNLVKKQLPEVKVLQVPERLYDYPGLIRKSIGLFYNLSNTAEDQKRNKMYKEQVRRGSVKKEFANLEDYIASIDLKMIVFENDKSTIPRMAQMSQKTNQFNLTTKRYAEGDVARFVEEDDVKVMTVSVADKYGDSGVTGLCIVNMDRIKKTAEIDTLLMSCRIIGRNIEYSFINYLIHELKKENISKITARYFRTLKNEQVKDFYDRCGFSCVDFNDTERIYKLDVNNYIHKAINYIEVVNGKTD